VSSSNPRLSDSDAEAERASHDLPDQIARARARFHQYRDAIGALETPNHRQTKRAAPE
jgi:hypothetical protein